MVVYKETPSSWKFTGKEVEEMKKKQMEQMDDSARRARLLAAEKRAIFTPPHPPRLIC